MANCMPSSLPSAREPGLGGGLVCTRQCWGCTLASSRGTNAPHCAQLSRHPWRWETAPELCVAHGAVRY